MRKKFATNLAFLLLLNLLIKPFWILGIDRVVQNRLGPEAYGTYFAVFNFSLLFSILLDFGINNFNNRAVSRNNKRAGEYLLNLMLLKFLLSILYLIFTFVAALLTGFSAAQQHMLLLLMVNQILLSAILYFRSNLAALQLFKTDSVISVMDRLLTILFCLALLYIPAYSGSFDIMWFIYAQTFALGLTALVALVAVWGKTAIAFTLWKVKYSRMILMKSLPFAMLGLLMGIYYRIDGVMIERMLQNGAHEAGVYAASFRLLDAVNMFGYLFATLLLPMFAGMLRKKQPVHDLVKFSGSLMLAGSIITASLCYAYAAPVVQMLYPDSTENWFHIFQVLMVTFIPMSSIYIYGTLLTANGSLKQLNAIALGGALLNIVLNLFMIPKFGALGAAWATLVTQVMVAGMHIWYAILIIRLPVVSMGQLFKWLLLALAATIPGIFMHYNSSVSWIPQAVISGGLLSLLAIVLGLVEVKQAGRLFKKG